MHVQLQNSTGFGCVLCPYLTVGRGPGGPGVTLEIYLHGADDKDYRARFTLIRTDGRWWIDDVHWTQEPDARDFSRT